jgi:predicted nucleic acid-binding protein
VKGFAGVTDNAVEAHVHFIVSSDPHLLDLGKFEKIRILSFANYLKEFEAR